VQQSVCISGSAFPVSHLPTQLLLLLLQAEPVVLLDPNTLSEDGTVALKDAVFRCVMREARRGAQPLNEACT
jgi:hypothetical protein